MDAALHSAVLSDFSSSSRSFVASLNDIATKRKTNAVYQLIGQEGMSHEPTFVYKVSAFGQDGIGKGRKKQEARQMAACDLLFKAGLIDAQILAEAGIDPSVLDRNEKDEQYSESPASTSVPCLSTSIDLSSMPLPDVSDGTQKEPSETVENIPPVVAESIENQPNSEKEKLGAVIYRVPECRADNPVGSLQELTLSIKWPPPRFELYSKTGLAHDTLFTIICYVWSYKSFGRGKSKKQAKREAAAAMYDLLKQSTEVKELWQKRGEAYAAKSTRHRKSQKTSVPKRAPPLQDMHADLMAKNLDTLDLLRNYTLQEVDALSDPESLLESLANSLQFDYIVDPPLFDKNQPANVSGRKKNLPDNISNMSPVPEEPVEDAIGILLTINSTKGFKEKTFFGLGPSKDAARRRAIINALHYIRIASLPSHPGFTDTSNPVDASADAPGC